MQVDRRQHYAVEILTATQQQQNFGPAQSFGRQSSAPALQNGSCQNERTLCTHPSLKNPVPTACGGPELSGMSAQSSGDKHAVSRRSLTAFMKRGDGLAPTGVLAGHSSSASNFTRERDDTTRGTVATAVVPASFAAPALLFARAAPASAASLKARRPLRFCCSIICQFQMSIVRASPPATRLAMIGSPMALASVLTGCGCCGLSGRIEVRRQYRVADVLAICVCSNGASTKKSTPSFSGDPGM